MPPPNRGSDTFGPCTKCSCQTAGWAGVALVQKENKCAEPKTRSISVYGTISEMQLLIPLVNYWRGKLSFRPIIPHPLPPLCRWAGTGAKQMSDGEARKLNADGDGGVVCETPIDGEIAGFF